MSDKWTRRLLLGACVHTLVGLAFMVWSVLDPRPVPVLMAMSFGQGLGTIGLLLFLVVVIGDLRRAKVILHEDEGAAKAPAEAGKS